MEKLTREEKELLVKMFKKQNLKCLMERPEGDETMHRNVVIFKNHHKKFAKFCREYGIKQVEALYIATRNFMEQYEKENLEILERKDEK